MYYAFVDGEYIGSSNHLAYLKKQVDKDMELGPSFIANIYRGERSYCYRFYNGAWTRIGSEKKNRPELPDWAHIKRSRTYRKKPLPNV